VAGWAAGWGRAGLAAAAERHPARRVKIKLTLIFFDNFGGYRVKARLQESELKVSQNTSSEVPRHSVKIFPEILQIGCQIYRSLEISHIKEIFSTFSENILQDGC